MVECNVRYIMYLFRAQTLLVILSYGMLAIAHTSLFMLVLIAVEAALMLYAGYDAMHIHNDGNTECYYVGWYGYIPALMVAWFALFVRGLAYTLNVHTNIMYAAVILGILAHIAIIWMQDEGSDHGVVIESNQVYVNIHGFIPQYTLLCSTLLVAVWWALLQTSWYPLALVGCAYSIITLAWHAWPESEA